MNIGFTPNEINALAEQLCPAILHRLDAAVKQHLKSSTPSLVRLTVKEVADQLKLSEKTILKYLAEGRLSGNNLGTITKPVWRISQKAVDDFLTH
ncbi:helix-turn-helix domain-containing protein [Hymenobacter busanensis]|uniref:Helix-turn-helix domain-containing protein n=1 Tax=Hymenobacter busanensis TaxID=2607656 RepID=A0A7L5A3L0_9BACT|nr:helix-turn-helix domain-containing protein [Hymenobacter busanensis]KAA9338431.1 helix-turn-helix domain-containing protein [Hymenobacter busanensis]QHJ09142.1 helix-turn-helix domain-containing protein [Hymenobacter busanensis]